MKPSQVLVVETPSGTAEDIQGLLSSCAITDVAVAKESEALNRLRRGEFYAVLFHEDAPMDGRGLLVTAKRETPNTPVIVIVEGTDPGRCAEWTAAGAFECLVKPVDPSSLLAAMQRALTRSQLCAAGSVKSTRPRQRSGEWSFGEMVGDSEAMQEVYHSITKVAQSDANICLYGESGTGKELIARAIHDSGRRQGRPFVILDCAAIPEGLMESEMFGHVRGAFTSAVGDRVGVFQLADTGTLFLDEVAELPVPLQAKLLRVIQNREFRRVGSSHSVRVDVRILAATNKDLPDLVKRGQFREDLFYRLDVISITVPPLRKRKEDIPLLLEHFVEQFNRNSEKQIRGISARTQRLLLKYDWPGNVRELQNCIERAGVMADEDIIDIGDLHQVLHPVAQAAAQTEGGAGLRDMEHTLIQDTLRQTRGNKTAAAALLGISLRGLHYKLKRLEAKMPRENT
ncbi:MAG: sigma 54-interacting transcriptional regulator [Candidatus Methylomirabilales bacterium]|nr:sigma-54 dependent transcriptional regulator [candidate division NC10 bacterium]